MDECDDAITLARGYWADVVRPVLDRAVPGLPRAATRIGPGSEVLRLDDEMSRDHDWGLRLQLLVTPGAAASVAALLEAGLPDHYLGHPTRIAFTGRSEPTLAVEVTSVDELVRSRLGFDPRRDAAVTDWLSLTGQAVLEITAGEVFEDTEGDLTSLRKALTWYPDDVWRYVIASGWRRIDQELPLMQRAGHRGDDLGSRVIAGRLVGLVMHLGFLLCRRWAPYPKWRGTHFASLPLPPEVRRGLDDVLGADDWRERGRQLAEVLDALAGQHERVGLPVRWPACVPFWDRPYLQVNQDLAPSLLADASDPGIRELPLGLGSIEQRTDNVDLLMHANRRRVAVGCPLAD